MALRNGFVAGIVVARRRSSSRNGSSGGEMEENGRATARVESNKREKNSGMEWNIEDWISCC